jgi:hypothetical protein
MTICCNVSGDHMLQCLPYPGAPVLQVAVAHAVGRAANPVNSVAPLQPMPVEPNPTPGVQEAVV